MFLSGCEKINIVEQSGLPEGMIATELEKRNDCSLSECSMNRIVRYKLENLESQISIDSEGIYRCVIAYGIDSRLEFYFCNLPPRFEVEGMKVRFSGKARDACGIRETYLGGQQIFAVELSEIKRIL